MFSPTYALQFNGEADHATLASVNNFPTNELTIAFWLRTTADNQGTFFSYATPDVANTILIRNAASLEFFLVRRGAFRTDIAVNDGQWHHLAMTWRQQDGEIIVYVDGERRASGRLNRQRSLAPAGFLILGQDQDVLGGGFEPEEAYAGGLADIRLWNQVLSPEEIRLRLNRSDALVAYWSFDGSNDQRVLDHSQNGNHLTLEGVQKIEVELPTPVLPAADHVRFAQHLEQSISNNQLAIGPDALEILGEFGDRIVQLWNQTLDVVNISIDDVSLTTQANGVIVEGRVSLLNIDNLLVRFEFLNTNQFNLRLLLPDSWQFSDSLRFLPRVENLDGLRFSNPFCIVSSVDGTYSQESDPQLPVASIFRENGLNFYVTLDLTDNQPLNEAYQVLEDILGVTARTNALVFRASLGGLINIPRIPGPAARPIVANNRSDRMPGNEGDDAQRRQRTFADNLYFVLSTDIAGEYSIDQLDAITFTNLGYGLRLGLSGGNPELQVFNSCTALVDTPSSETLTFVGTTRVITDGRSIGVSGYLRMEGEWTNPLGLRNLIIGDDPNRDAIVPGPRGSEPRVAGMELGIGFNPNQRIPLPIVGTIGRLRVDLPGAEDLDLIGGIRFNGQNVFASVLWLEQEELPMLRLVRVGLGLLNDAVTFPEPLEQFFDGLEDIFAAVTLRDIYGYVVPESTTFVGEFFRRGIYARGTASIYGFEAHANISADETSGLICHSVMDPIAVELIPGSDSMLRIEGSQNFETVDRFADIPLPQDIAPGPEMRLIVPLPGIVTLPAQLSEFIQAADNIQDVDTVIATINSAPVQNQIERLISPSLAISGYISSRVSLFDIAQDTLIGLSNNNLWFVLEGNLRDIYAYNLTYFADVPPVVGTLAESVGATSLVQTFHLAGEVAFDLNLTVGPITFQGIPVADQITVDTRFHAALTIERQLLFASAMVGGQFEFNGFEFDLPHTTVETPRELRNIEDQAVELLRQGLNQFFEDVATRQNFERLGVFFRDVYGRSFEATARILAQATYGINEVIQVLAGAGADVVTIARISATVFNATAEQVSAALLAVGYSLAAVARALLQSLELGVGAAARILYALEDRLALVSRALVTAGYEVVSVGRTLVAIFEGAEAWPRTAYVAIDQWSDAAFRAITTWSDTAWDVTTEWSRGAWRATADWLDAGWESTTQWSDNAWDTTTQWIGAAWRASTQWTAVGWGAIANWPDDVWDATTEWTAGRWRETLAWTADIWNDVETLAQTLVDTLEAVSNTAIDSLEQVGRTAVDTLTQEATQAVNTLNSAATTSVNRINGAATAAVNRINGTATTAIDNVEDAGEDAVRQIRNLINQIPVPGGSGSPIPDIPFIPGI
ncbi:MAG: LamG-like jellyroll fold domain-containing protein [Cyanobacteria bacterium P01_F01_bin.86]